MKPLIQRWLRQAEADLQAARDSARAGHFEWACFQAQQSAEKALKALLYQKGRTSAISHSIADLLEESTKYVGQLASLTEEAKYLDTFYLATRYPNALPGERAPADYYGEKEAERCLSYAESILTAVKNTMPG